MPLRTKDVNGFDESDRILAECSRILSHPARIAILRKLAEKNTCICGEIVSDLPLAQSTVSQHLRELREAGFIDGTVEGTSSCYCINWKALRNFFKRFERLGKELEACAKKAGRCCPQK